MNPNASLRAGARRDYGRLLARLLCAVFAVIGALPLLGGYLVGTKPVLEWAASETARVLRDELGVEATYRVEMQLWPLTVSLHDVAIPATDGGPPALETKRMAIRPRIFSLLAGRLDVGDIEIDEPKSRVVIRDGKVTNVAYKLPESKGPAPKLERAPFASLAVSDAELSLDIDGAVVTTSAVDLDVFAEHGPSFEIAVRAGESTVSRKREVELAFDTEGASDLTTGKVTAVEHDEDVICQLDLRVHVKKGSVLLRRLSLVGAADTDTAKGTRPRCRGLGQDDPRRVAVRLSQLKVEPTEGDDPKISGHVVARAPTRIVNRFVPTLPLHGWVGISAKVAYTGENKLPAVSGKLRGEGIRLGGYRLAKKIAADVRIDDDVIRIPETNVEFAAGNVTIRDCDIDVLAEKPTLSAREVEARGVEFPALMRDLDVTPDTVVHWDHDRVLVSKLTGTLAPLHLDGTIDAQTSNFEVFDRAYHDSGRRHMIGVRSATIRGKIGVRPTSFDFINTRATFGNSSVLSSVSIGFHNDIKLSIPEGGAKIDLKDISPLVDIEMAGVAELSARMAGKANNPLLTGEAKIKDFWFGGFPIGQVLSSKVRFRPLKVDFTDVRGRTGKSSYVVPTARLNFDTKSSVLADATIESDQFDLRDFLAMWHFDKDPRFDPIFGSGHVKARIHYDIGGDEDRCGNGFLRVAGSVDMNRLELFEERYDSGTAKFDFRWLDRDASYQGVELDVPSMTLTKGSGVALGSLTIRPGAVVRGHAVATAVPLSRIQSVGALGAAMDARISAIAEVYGTIDDLQADAHVTMSPARIGSKRLPASDFAVNLRPVKREHKSVGKTRCGRPVPTEFARADYDRDERQGVFHVTGKMFGGQIELSDYKITRQRAKTSWGIVDFKGLDLGAIAELSPAVAASETRLDGRLTGSLEVEDLPLERFTESRATVKLEELYVGRNGFRIDLLPGSDPIVLADGKLEVPALAMSATTPGGQKGVFDVRATIAELGGTPNVDARLAVRPADLSAFAGLIPRAERASGKIRGQLAVRGPVGSLRYTGGVELVNGELAVRGMPTPLSKMNVAVAIDGDEVRIIHGSAKVGGGTLNISGSAPLLGYTVGDARAVITARNISVPVAQGVKTTLDADLTATVEGGDSSGAVRVLPRVAGNVTVSSFEYTRPVTMAADISTLTKRGRRTRFEAYDPDDDALEFDITLRAPRPLKLRNNLIDAELVVDRKGLTLAGTNQRFGMRGSMRIKPGGRIQFRRSEFEVRQGYVRFDDATRIAPQVDVTAVTEYRRYSGSVTATEGASATSASAGGRWNVTMHAYGDAEKLRIDLTSDPELAQDDIFLLLTLGLTRAELDQAQSASLGESVALEALGTLTGADRAVTDALPVIDEFSFGSAYSSRTGRTEPTVTVGKRLAERIRARVTSGLAESREVRSNLEWRLSPRVSVEGSYDNVNDISSSTLGNLGADIRWRLEFD